MSNIDDIIANYQSFDELKIFCSAQMKQIQSLSKKNKELQEKLDKALLDKPTPSLASVNLEVSKEDAKTISQIQLNLLKKISYERELSTDEAKRVDLFNRILKEDASKDKSDESDVSTVNSAELLKLVE